MNVSYDYYRIFYYVAKYKSFSKAAAILMNNQPNITRCMNILEQQLNCQLFVRSNRGIRLTKEGETLYRHVSVVVSQLDQAENEIEQMNQMETESLTISITGTVLHTFCVPVMKKFYKKYPTVHMNIYNRRIASAMDEVIRGVSDFAIVSDSYEQSFALRKTKLFEVGMALICNKSLEEELSSPIHLKDILKYPLISIDHDSIFHAFFAEYFHKHGLPYKPNIEVTVETQIKYLVEQDMGIGFIPDILLDESDNDKIFKVDIIEGTPKRDIILVENKIYPLSTSSERFKELFIEYCRERFGSY